MRCLTQCSTQPLLPLNLSESATLGQSTKNNSYPELLLDEIRQIIQKKFVCCSIHSGDLLFPFRVYFDSNRSTPLNRWLNASNSHGKRSKPLSLFFWSFTESNNLNVFSHNCFASPKDFFHAITRNSLHQSSTCLRLALIRWATLRRLSRLWERSRGLEKRLNWKWHKNERRKKSGNENHLHLSVFFCGEHKLRATAVQIA